MRIILAVLFLFSGLSAGFLKGTKIKTPTGFQTVETLHVGAQIETNPSNGESVAKISHIVSFEPAELYVIETPVCVISVTGEHLFWDPIQVGWLRADQLDSANWLMDFNGMAHRILHVAHCAVDTTVVAYELFTDTPSRIYVTMSCILCHS